MTRHALTANQLCLNKALSMHELCTSNIYYDFNLLTQSRKLPIMELQSVISSMRETKPSEDLKSF